MAQRLQRLMSPRVFLLYPIAKNKSPCLFKYAAPPCNAARNGTRRIRCGGQELSSSQSPPLRREDLCEGGMTDITSSRSRIGGSFFPFPSDFPHLPILNSGERKNMKRRLFPHMSSSSQPDLLCMITSKAGSLTLTHTHTLCIPSADHIHSEV